MWVEACKVAASSWGSALPQIGVRAGAQGSMADLPTALPNTAQHQAHLTVHTPLHYVTPRCLELHYAPSTLPAPAQVVVVVRLQTTNTATSDLATSGRYPIHPPPPPLHG